MYNKRYDGRAKVSAHSPSPKMNQRRSIEELAGRLGETAIRCYRL